MKTFIKKNLSRLLLLLALCLTGFVGWSVWQQIHLPYLTVIGNIDMFDGLGRQAVELVQVMQKLISVECIPTHIKNFVDIPDETKMAMISKKSSRLGKVIVCQEPLRVSCKKLRGDRSKQIRIGYAMVESTRAAPFQVELINHHLDLLAIPDRFLIEVYKKSGVTIPIFELPLGRDFTAFLDSPLKKKRNTPFIFGSLGAGFSRKNHALLISAFHKAFKNRSDVRLLINSRMCEKGLREELEKQIHNLKTDNISFTELALGSRAYVQLLSCIDCYVSISKGEGFSIQPREAMAMGIPVIVTDNTGQHTICESGLVKVVASPIQEQAYYELRPTVVQGNFFQCKEADVIAALLDVEKNYDHYLQNGEAARTWASQYQFNALAPLYQMLIQPKKIILGEEDKVTSEYLMTSSKALYKKYQKILRS